MPAKAAGRRRMGGCPIALDASWYLGRNFSRASLILCRRSAGCCWEGDATRERATGRAATLRPDAGQARAITAHSTQDDGAQVRAGVAPGIAESLAGAGGGSI